MRPFQRRPLISQWFSPKKKQSNRRPNLRPKFHKPFLELLEDRTLLSSATATFNNNSGFLLSLVGWSNSAKFTSSPPATIQDGTNVNWISSNSTGTVTYTVGNTGVQDRISWNVSANTYSQTLIPANGFLVTSTTPDGANPGTVTFGLSNATSATNGIWGKVTQRIPSGDGAQTMMLLTDGTVLIHGGSGQASNAWYELKPDALGNYANGTIVTAAPAGTSRLFFPSNVLPDGRVFLYGGEYDQTGQVELNTGGFFDPTQTTNGKPGAWSNAQSLATNFPAVTQFGDQPTELLANGTILAGSFTSATYLYDPSTDTWTQTGNRDPNNAMTRENSNEESWVKLPDGSILTYDIYASWGLTVSAAGRVTARMPTFQAERYMPSTGTWVYANNVDAANPPSILSDPPAVGSTSPGVGAQGSELGPAFLLPSGRVIYFGTNGNTAFYDSATNTWSAGTNEPKLANGRQLVATDNPGAVLPNGDVLIALSPRGRLVNGGYNFPNGSYIYLFDPTANGGKGSFLDVTPQKGITSNAYKLSMLVIPTGQVLMSTDSGTLQIYTPPGSPMDAWRPTISIAPTQNADGSYTLTGTQLTGLDEGANYGDDAEMSSNYPIVQLTDAAGMVFYARTFGWTSVVAAQGAQTTQFTLTNLPGGKTLNDFVSLTVIANGIPSAPFALPHNPVGGFNLTNPANINNMLAALDTFGANLNEDGQFSQDLTGVDPSLGDVLELGSIFNTDLAEPAQNYFNFVAQQMQTADGSDLAAALTNTDPNNTVTVTFDSTTDTFNVSMDVTILDASAPLTLGPQAAAQGFATAATVDLSVEMKTSFSFTVDASGNVTIDSFNPVTAVASVNTTSLSADADVGALDAPIGGGTVNLMAEVDAAISNITNADLADTLDSGGPNVTLTLGSSNAFSANLPLTATLGSSTPSGTLSVPSTTDVFIDPNNPGMPLAVSLNGGLSSFGNLNISDVLNQLSGLVSTISQFSNSASNIQIPFAKGLSLGSAINLGTALIQELGLASDATQVVGTSATQPTTLKPSGPANPQVAAAQNVLAGTFLAPADGRLTNDAHFTLTVSNADGTSSQTFNVTIPADATQNPGNSQLADLVTEINNVLGDINNALTAAGLGVNVTADQSDGALTLTASNNGLLTVSAALNDPAVTELHLPVAAAMENFVGKGQWTASSAPSAPLPPANNGFLPYTADAHFIITIADQQPVEITVPRNASSTSATDMVNDIQNALNSAFSAAGLGNPITVGLNSSGYLTLTDVNGDPFIINAARGDPALTQLHLPLPTVGPSSINIQGLLTDLATALHVDPTVLGINYVSAAQKLTFSVNLHAALPSLQVPLNFNLNFAPLGAISSTGNLSISASGNVQFTVGFQLGSSGPAAMLASSSPVPPVPSAETSTFQLQVNGGALTAVSVSLPSTTNAADIVTAINTGLTNAGITNVTATLQSSPEQIVLAGTSPGITLALFASPTDPIVSLLGFPNSITATLATPANKSIPSSLSAGKFNLSVNGTAPKTISVANSASFQDIVSNINQGLAAASITNVEAILRTGDEISGGGTNQQLALVGTDPSVTSLQVSAFQDPVTGVDPFLANLNFQSGDAAHNHAAFIVQSASFTGTATLSANATLSAQVSRIQVSANAVVNGNLSLGFNVGTMSGTPIPLSGLLSAITSASPTLSGIVNLTLSNLSLGAGLGGLSLSGGSIVISAGIITKASNDNPIQITSDGSFAGTSPPLANGNQVTIQGVGGDTAADGTFYVKEVDANTFSLYTDSSLMTSVDGSTSGSYTGGGTWVMVQLNNLDPLKGLENLDFNNFFASLPPVLQSLQQIVQSAPPLNVELPVINRKLSDVLGFANKLATDVQQLQQNPNGALQELVGELDSALGLDAASSPVTLTLDSAHQVLVLSFHFAFGFHTSLPLDLQNELKSIPGLSQLVSTSGNSSSLSISGDVNANFTLGFDLAHSFAPFLDPSLTPATGITVGANVDANPLNLNVNLGPVGLAIKDGKVILNDGSSTDTNEATMTLGLNSGRHYLVSVPSGAPSGSDTLGAGDFADPTTAGAITGAVTVDLPLFAKLPTNSTLQSIGDLSLSIPNLQQFIADLFHGNSTSGDVIVNSSVSLPSFNPFSLFQNFADQNPSTFLGGIENVLNILQVVLNSNVFSLNLPLIGTKLQGAANFLRDLVNKADTGLNQLNQLLEGDDTQHLISDLQDALFLILGPKQDPAILGAAPFSNMFQEVTGLQTLLKNVGSPTVAQLLNFGLGLLEDGHGNSISAFPVSGGGGTPDAVMETNTVSADVMASFFNQSGTVESMSGLVNGQTYYVILPTAGDSTKIQLAASPGGPALTLTPTTVTATQDLLPSSGNTPVTFDSNADISANMIQFASATGLTAGQAVVYTLDLSTNPDAVQINLQLGHTLSTTLPLAANIGLPGLGLSTAGSLSVSLPWTLNLGFGISQTDGFYLAPSSNFVSAGLNVTLAPGSNLTGTLGFLTISATDNPTIFITSPNHGLSTGNQVTITGVTGDTAANGTWTITVIDSNTFSLNGSSGVANGTYTGGGTWMGNNTSGMIVDASPGTHIGGMFALGLSASSNNRLTLNALLNDPTSFINPSFTAIAGVHLALQTSFGSGSVAADFPSLGADLDVSWAFDSTNTMTGDGNLPNISFNNVTLDLGTFISNFAEPVIKSVEGIIKPLEPILDVLTARLPVISDLVGSDVSLLSLAATFGDIPESDVQTFETFYSEIKALINLVNFSATGATISLGSFNLGSQDVRQALPADQQLDVKNEVDQSLNGQIPAADSSFVGALTTTDGNIQFPLLTKPSMAFDLLLGKNVNLVVVTIPTISGGFTYTQEFPIFGPLVALLSGGVNITVQGAFGYDTKGLQEFATDHNPSDLLDGFYIDTTKPILIFQGQISAGAGIDLGIIDAGVEGGLFLTVNFSFNDPNHTGKLRFSDIESDPDCVFKIDGDISFRLYAFFKIDLLFFSIDDELTIANIDLVKFGFNPCQEPVLATPIGGSSASGEVLRLNMGPNAGARLHGDTSSNNEKFIVTDLGADPAGDKIQVKFHNNIIQTYDNVKEVVGAGGTNTNLQLNGMKIPVDLTSGSNNTITEDASSTGSLTVTGLTGGSMLTNNGSGPVVASIVDNNNSDQNTIKQLGNGGLTATVSGGKNTNTITNAGSGPLNITVMGGNNTVINSGGGPGSLTGSGDTDFELIDGSLTLGHGVPTTDPNSGEPGLSFTAPAAMSLGTTTYTSMADGSTDPNPTKAISTVNLRGGSSANTFYVHSYTGQANLDGLGGADSYIVDINLPRPATTSFNINVAEDPANGTGGNLTVNGKAMGANSYNDFIFRVGTGTWNSTTDTGGAFVAGLYGPASVQPPHELIGQNGGLVPAQFERINYGPNLQHLFVNVGGDAFSANTIMLDDNAAPTTINCGPGTNTVQVGQIFKSERDAVHAQIVPGDQFATAHTTRGFLTNGISDETWIFGGQAVLNTFTVFHNIGPLHMFGSNNPNSTNNFNIRAFILDEGSTASSTWGEQGTTTSQYVTNGQVYAVGGAGTNKLSILLTEVGDNVVLEGPDPSDNPSDPKNLNHDTTPSGYRIIGAGISVNFSNMQELSIDAAEGNDTIYVLATDPSLKVDLLGDLGSDTFIIGGNVPANTVVKNDGTFLPATMGPHKLNGIAGSLLTIDGEGGTGSEGGLGTPGMLPGESSLLPPSGAVVAYSGTGQALTTDTMTIDGSTLGVPTGNYLVDTITNPLTQLVGHTLEIALGMGVGRFWLITGVRQDTNNPNNYDLTLRNPAKIPPEWVQAGLPNNQSKYSITHLSQNFFVDPSNDTNTLKIFDDSDNANVTGNLTSTMVTGLGMTTGIQYINGITENDINLGSGNDQFTIANTPAGTVTRLSTGTGTDVVNVKSVSDHTFVTLGAGSDTVNVHNDSNQLQNLSGLLTVNGVSNGSAGYHVVNINDSGNTSNTVGVLTSSSLTGLGFPQVNAIQTIFVNASQGHFQLSYGTATTAALPYNISATDLQATMQSLTGINAGDVVVTRADKAIVVRFQGNLANRHIAQLGATASADLMLSVEQLGGGVAMVPGTVAVSTRNGGSSATPLNDMQAVTVNATAGTYTLSLLGGSLVTGPISYNASADTVRSALQAIVPLGFPQELDSDITVDQFGNTYLIGFQGKLRRLNHGMGVDLFQANTSALTGTVSVTERTDGLNYYGIENLNIDTSLGNTIFNVQGTTAGSAGFFGAGGVAITNVHFHGGASGIGQVYISSNADLDFASATPAFDFLTGNLDDVNGALNLDVGSGRHRLMISNEGTPIGHGPTGQNVDGKGVVITGNPSHLPGGNSAALGLASNAEIFTTGLSGRPDLFPQGGISYRAAPDGNFFDGITYWLGSGDDSALIDEIHRRPGGRTMTLLNTGLGNDHVTVNLAAGPADTETWQGPDFFALNAGGGSQSVNPSSVVGPVRAADTIDASGSTLPLVIFGDFGPDFIRGGQGGNIILGHFGHVQFTDPVTGQIIASLGAGGHGDFTSSQQVAPTWIYSRDITIGSSDTIRGGAGQDLLIGGAAGNVIDGGPGASIPDGGPGVGDDLIFGPNVQLHNRFTDTTNQRFEALSGTQIYSTVNEQSQVDTVARAYRGMKPDGSPAPVPWWATYQVTILHHTAEVQANPDNSFGSSYIAGGGGNNVIFGDLGNDTIQGNGSIDSYLAGNPVGAYRDASGALHVTPSFEAATDGNNYIEGGGGRHTVIFGNGGQNDIIGGNSSLFSLTTPDQRPDGSAIIFAGAGTRISRDYVVPTTDPIYPIRHAHNASVIVANNGNIYDLVGTNSTDTGGFIQFNYDQPQSYDNRGPLRIIPRAVTLLDYTPGGPTVNPAAVNDIGLASEIHAESGDTTIYGGPGNDIIYGGAGDDDIIGGYGNKWISGGAGNAAIIGSDGRIFRSRNGLAEPLYGIAAIPANQLNQVISTPGKIQQATINVAGAIVSTVDLEPFSEDTTWNGTVPEFGGGISAPHNMDDIIYGGLGNDTIHGGPGDDAISGADALPYAFLQTVDANGNLVGVHESDWYHPYNPGNSLLFNPIDPNTKHPKTAGRTGDFAAYDEFDPRRKILLNADGSLNKTGAGVPWFLDFNAGESSGSDNLFGDLGNNWIVGGTTGTNHLYGGFGDDVLDARASQDIDGGLNDIPNTAALNRDVAFGGAGMDVLIADSSADRLIDWVGNFNSYIVPFSQWGMATVSRTVQPQLPQFLYALSKSDGADQTRAADTGADPTRNGEPLGELGVVLQHDAAWHSQTGAPADQPPGNIGGTKRNVTFKTNFTNNSTLGFFPDSGTWSITGSKYEGSAAAGSDAVSLLYLNQWQPSYAEFLVTLKMTGSGAKQDGYLIFDYQNNMDFKYAGIDLKAGLLRIGHRTAAGWIDSATLSFSGSLSSNYSFMLVLNGTTAQLILGTTTLSSSFANPLNTGSLALGVDSAVTTFSSVTVQFLAPTLVYTLSGNFSSGVATNFTPQSGQWVVANSKYTGTPGAAIAMTTRPLVVAPWSYVQYQSGVNVAASGGIAGLIFGYNSPVQFLFAEIVAGTNQVILGHVTAAGRITDAVSTQTITPGTTYTLMVAIDQQTVTVVLNGVSVVAYTYNFLPNQGGVGLFTQNSAASFTNLTIQGSDPNAGPLQVAVGGLQAVQAPVAGVTESQLQAIGQAAILRWEASPAFSASSTNFNGVSFQVVDLPSQELGQTDIHTILIDRTAAGWGWFIDLTPLDDSEFSSQAGNGQLQAGPSSPAHGHMDLETVVMHELGHLLGLSDLDSAAQANQLMATWLPAGVRRLPNGMTPAQVLAATSTTIAGQEAAGRISNPSIQIDTLEIRPTRGAAQAFQIGGTYIFSGDFFFRPIAIWENFEFFRQHVSNMEIGGTYGWLAFNRLPILNDYAADDLFGNQGRAWFWGLGFNNLANQTEAGSFWETIDSQLWEEAVPGFAAGLT